MAIYLIDGKPHRMCECAQFSEACPRGLKRTPQTAGYSRCCIPAPDVAMTTIALSESTRREPTPIGLFWQTADGRWHFSPGSLKRGDIHDNGRPIHIALLGEEAK